MSYYERIKKYEQLNEANVPKNLKEALKKDLDGYQLRDVYELSIFCKSLLIDALDRNSKCTTYTHRYINKNKEKDIIENEIKELAQSGDINEDNHSIIEKAAYNFIYSYLKGLNNSSSYEDDEMSTEKVM